MDMQFHWLRDREAQKQFHIYWKPGGHNLADYYTKHHPPTHYRQMRSEFLTKYKEVQEFLHEQNRCEANTQHSCKGVLDFLAKHEVKLLNTSEASLHA